jgi:pyruvate-formate lyase-activating enzyme
LLFEVNPDIPFTILGFSPEYQMKRYKSPKISQMIEAYMEVKAIGLRNVRLGNTGLFASTEQDYNCLKEMVGVGNF